MKRIHSLISLTAAVAVFVAGCGGAAQKPTSATPEIAPGPAAGEQAESRGAATLEFEVIKESMLPQELAKWTDMTQLPKSTPSARVGDHLYVAVVGGQESVGASAILVRQVEFTENPATVTVKAVVTPGKSAPESQTFPRSYIRIPYAASKPVPVVWTHFQVEAAKGVTDPNTPVSSPANPGGVAPSNPGAPAEPPATPANPPGNDGPLTFTPMAGSALPDSLSAWTSSTVQIPGGVARYVDGTLYLMVSGGQRNSGGYSVEIRSVEVEGQTVRVSALLRTPGPGAIVTQAITYPKAFAKVDHSGTGEPQVIVDWQ